MTALFAILCLTILGLWNGVDTSMAIATVAAAVSASNSYQKKGQPPATGEHRD